MARTVWPALLAALLVVGGARAEEGSDVIELTEANFDDTLGGMDTVLVEFYAPW